MHGIGKMRVRFLTACDKTPKERHGGWLRPLSPAASLARLIRRLLVPGPVFFPTRAGASASDAAGRDRKDKMTILILNQYYPPDQSATARILEVIVEHVRCRDDVTVLSGRPSYQSSVHYPWRFLRQIKSSDARIVRLGSTALPRTRMHGRVTNYLTYLALLLPVALLVRCDLVVGMTDPPLTGVIGAFVAKVRRRRFVYYLQDLHPDMALASNLISKGMFYRFWDTLQLRALRAADQVIVIGDDMKKRVEAKGIENKKIAVIRNTFGMKAEMPQLPKNDVIVSSLRNNFALTVIHAGNIGHYADWETAVKAAALLEKNSIGFVFIGEGAEKTYLVRMARNLTNVRCIPYFPEEDLPSVYAAGDLFMINIRKGLEGLVVPSKIYSVLSFGKPVLAVAGAESEVAGIVRAYQCGIALEPGDPERLAEALTALLRRPERLRHMGANAARASRALMADNPLERLQQHLFS